MQRRYSKAVCGVLPRGSAQLPRVCVAVLGARVCWGGNPWESVQRGSVGRTIAGAEGAWAQILRGHSWWSHKDKSE